MPSDEKSAKILKKYGWLAVVFPVLLGLWLAMPALQDKDSVPTEDIPSDTEQSLRSLDAADNPQGAPGSPLTGSSQRGQAAGAEAVFPGAPASAKPGAGMQEVSPQAAKSGAAAKTSSGGNEAKLPDVSSPAHGRLSAGSSHLAEGSSSASLPPPKPFGLGPNPASIAPSDSGSAAARAPRLAALRGQGITLDSLKRAANIADKALDSDAERASGFGSRAFDAAAAHGGALAALKAAAASGLQEGNVPADLKTNDPHMDSKQFEPPAVGPPKDVARDNPQGFSQQIMMMLVMMAVGGLLGPSLNGIGAGIASGLGLSLPKNIGGGSNVTNQITANLKGG